MNTIIEILLLVMGTQDKKMSDFIALKHKMRCIFALRSQRWNEGTKERRNEGTKERRNEGTKERRNEGTKERRNEGTKERRNEGTKERRNEGTKERRNEGTKERRNEGTKGRRNQRNTAALCIVRMRTSTFRLHLAMNQCTAAAIISQMVIDFAPQLWSVTTCEEWHTTSQGSKLTSILTGLKVLLFLQITVIEVLRR